MRRYVLPFILTFFWERELVYRRNVYFFGYADVWVRYEDRECTGGFEGIRLVRYGKGLRETCRWETTRPASNLKKPFISSRLQWFRIITAIHLLSFIHQSHLTMQSNLTKLRGYIRSEPEIVYIEIDE